MTSKLPNDNPRTRGDRIVWMLGSRSILSAVSILSKIVVRAGTFIVIAPIIGPANQGAIVVTSTWAATVLLIMAYGFQVRVLREVAINTGNAHSVVVGDLRSMAVLVIPSGMAAVVIGMLVLVPEDRLIFGVLFFAAIGSVIGDYCASSLRSLDQFRREAILSLGTSLLQMVLVIGTALASTSMIALATAMLVSRAIYAVASLRALFSVKAMRDSRNVTARAVPRTLSEAFPFFVDASLTVMLNGIDILLLNHFVSKEAIGNYAVGSRIVQLFLVVPWIATNAVVPTLVRAGAAFRYEFCKLFLGMLLFAFAGAASLMVVGPLFVKLFLGEKYADLNAMWPVFAILIMVRFVESSFGIGMTALGRMTARVWVQIGATISIALLAIILLNEHGINAFVLGIAVTYVLVGSYYVYSLRNELLR